MKLGNLTPSFRLGSVTPSRIYRGSSLVWQSAVGVAPNYDFSSGGVGSWVSSRGSSALNASSNALVVTSGGSTDGASIDLGNAFMVDGNWRLQMRITTIGASTRIIVRYALNQSLLSQITLYDASPPLGNSDIDVTFTRTGLGSSWPWFGVISTWTNGATSFSIDNVILTKL